MERVQARNVYVPTVREPCGPLVVVTRPPTQSSRALQAVAQPCRQVADVVLRTAMECKKKALRVTAMIIIKLTSVGKFIINYMKKDFLKKEGVSFKKSLVIYKGSAKGMGRMIQHTI